MLVAYKNNKDNKSNFNSYVKTTEYKDYTGPINTNEYIPNLSESNTPQSISSNIEKPYDSSININEYIPNLKKENNLKQ